MKRVTPDGIKIARLRKALGKKQSEVAERTGISERTLRNIEKNNTDIQEYILVNIAKVLETSPDTIRYLDESFINDTFTQNKFGFVQMKLDRINSGRRIFDMASASDVFEYMLKIDLDMEMAEIIASMLSTIEVKVKGSLSSYRDKFSGKDFADIFRAANLNQILQQLKERDVVILANYYTRKKIEKEYNTDPDSKAYLINFTKLVICVTDLNDTDVKVFIESDDGLKFGNEENSYELDDDLPF